MRWQKEVPSYVEEAESTVWFFTIIDGDIEILKFDPDDERTEETRFESFDGYYGDDEIDYYWSEEIEAPTEYPGT